MRFLCLEYCEPQRLDDHSEESKHRFKEQYQAYHTDMCDHNSGLIAQIFIGTENAMTLRLVSGSLDATELVSHEKVRQLVGFLVLDALDLNHALMLIANHPCLQFGSVDVHACQP